MASHLDPAERLRALIDQVEPQFRARFLAVVHSIKSSLDLESIAQLIELGRVEEALVSAEVAALRIGNIWGEAFRLAGNETGTFIGSQIDAIVNFDEVNHGAIEAMTDNQLRLVREFGAEQSLATREALLDGIQRGINPNEMAIAVRESIGLTQYQQQIINNYRRQLEQLDAGLLDRALRDKRFDPTVLRAIRDQQQLSEVQIDRMVERYTEKWLKYRSEVIARTESLRSVHEGAEEMYRQAIEAGTLSADDLIRTWDTSKRPNVRDSHRAMEGQKRKWDEPFLSGDGNLLMRPGDLNAPGSDTIDCKCALTIRFTDEARQQNVPLLITIQ